MRTTVTQINCRVASGMTDRSSTQPGAERRSLDSSRRNPDGSSGPASDRPGRSEPRSTTSTSSRALSDVHDVRKPISCARHRPRRGELPRTRARRRVLRRASRSRRSGGDTPRTLGHRTLRDRTRARPGRGRPGRTDPLRARRVPARVRARGRRRGGRRAGGGRAGRRSRPGPDRADRRASRPRRRPRPRHRAHRRGTAPVRLYRPRKLVLAVAARSERRAARLTAGASGGFGARCRSPPDSRSSHTARRRPAAAGRRSTAPPGAPADTPPSFES